MKKPWTITSRANSAELLLYGDISDYVAKKTDVTAQQLYQDLRAQGDVGEIKVRINSAGGSVFAAIAMYNTLRRHKARKVAYIDALAASAATLVMMACDEIVMAPNARIMIHNPYADIEGDARAFAEAANRLEDARNILLDAYMRRVKITKEKVIAMMDAETWLTAEEAVRYGLCDRIESGIAIAARYNAGVLVAGGVEHDLRRYRRPPTNWVHEKERDKKMGKKFKIKNDAVESATNVMVICPECGAEFQAVLDAVVVEEAAEMEVDLPIETVEEIEEVLAKARGLRMRSSVTGSVTCPECGHVFDVAVDNESDGAPDELQEELEAVLEELIEEPVSIPDDPIEAKAYVRGLRAGIKSAKATMQKGSAAFGARVRDAQASGSQKVKTGVYNADKTDIVAARRIKTAAGIAEFANKARGVKKNG